MKQGWEIKKLGEVCEVLNGYAFDSNLFTDDNTCVPIIRIRDIKRGYTETFYKGEYAQEYIINKGNYLIGMDGEFNIAEWSGKDSLLNQRVCKLSVVSSELMKRFVLWYMSIALKQIEDETPFVTVKHLSSKKLLNIPIPVPPLPVQEQIVSELDLLSGIIEKKREQLKEFDALAQSIFYDMFGDPITNEKGWEVKKLKDVCIKLFAGGDVPKENYSETCTEEYNIPIYSNGIGDNALYGYTCIKKVEDVSITISGRGTIGYCEVRKAPFYPIIRLIVATPLISTVLPITLKYIIDNLDIKSTGGAIPQLTIPMIKDRFIPIPPLPLQHQFASKIEAIEKQKELIKQSISETETLFNARMQEHFG